MRAKSLSENRRIKCSLHACDEAFGHCSVWGFRAGFTLDQILIKSPPYGQWKSNIQNLSVDRHHLFQLVVALPDDQHVCFLQGLKSGEVPKRRAVPEPLASAERPKKSGREVPRASQ